MSEREQNNIERGRTSGKAEISKKISCKPLFSAADFSTSENDIPIATPEIAPKELGTALLFRAPEPLILPEIREDVVSSSSRRSRRGSRADFEDSDEDFTNDNNKKSAAGRKSTGVSSANKDKKSRKTDADAAAERDSRAKKRVIEHEVEIIGDEDHPSRRRRRRRLRETAPKEDLPNTEVTPLRGSTRLEAKRQRRKEGRRDVQRSHVVTEVEFLARRDSVDRRMLVRERDGLNQIAVLEDGLLVENYVARHTQVSMVGNVYLGRIQNVLPSMEAAFVDLGKGRNAVLYAGEVNWDDAGLEGKSRRIEEVMRSGDTVLVQVTKDPIGHKGARLTSLITLAGRFLVLVPSGARTGISRKLPDKERKRLKKLLKQIVPKGAGAIVRTAAEGVTEEQLRADVERLMAQWAEIEKKTTNKKAAPALLRAEPELALRVVRDIFNEDFTALTVQGTDSWESISEYVSDLTPDLADKLHRWSDKEDIFRANRVDEQLAKGMDRNVWLPSGGSLVIDRTEAMTVVDVNTGKFTGSGSTLEETITKNNLEAAEEIVRQLRLRDIGGMIVIDFVDMVLEANRDLVLRRLIECLGRDRTRHQVTEVTSLGLVQMTRKRVGQGLVEAFSTKCEHCEGRGFIVHTNPVESADTKSAKSERFTKKTRKNTVSEDPPPVASSEKSENHGETRKALVAIASASGATNVTSDDTSVAEDSPEQPAASPEKAKKTRRSSRRNNRGSARTEARRESKDSSPHNSQSEPLPAVEIEVPVPQKRQRRRAVSGGNITAGDSTADSFIIVAN